MYHETVIDIHLTTMLKQNYFRIGLIGLKRFSL